MTARFSVKNSHIEDDLILVLKKQTPTVKVITVRITFIDTVQKIRGGHEKQKRGRQRGICRSTVVVNHDNGIACGEKGSF